MQCGPQPGVAPSEKNNQQSQVIDPVAFGYSAAECRATSSEVLDTDKKENSNRTKKKIKQIEGHQHKIINKKKKLRIRDPEIQWTSKI